MEPKTFLQQKKSNNNRTNFASFVVRLQIYQTRNIVVFKEHNLEEYRKQGSGREETTIEKNKVMFI